MGRAYELSGLLRLSAAMARAGKPDLAAYWHDLAWLNQATRFSMGAKF